MVLFPIRNHPPSHPPPKLVRLESCAVSTPLKKHQTRYPQMETSYNFVRCPHPIEHLTKYPQLECGVPSQLMLKHLLSSVVSLAQLVSSSVALPGEFVCD